MGRRESCGRVVWGARSLGQIRHLIIAVFLGAALTVTSAPGPASAAEEIPGAFKAPPVGTVAEYFSSASGTFKSLVLEVDGKEIFAEYLNADDVFRNKPNSREYTALVPMSLDRATQFDRDRIDRFFPLVVGEKIKFTYGQGIRIRRRSITILRTEVVSVPAGDFIAYVMKIVDRGPLGGPVAERVFWYSPLVGLLVKTETKETGGPRRGRTYFVELEKVIDPDGMQIYPITAAVQRTIKLTAADGQRLFDARDYAGAANAWFSAAQSGDALAMLKLGEMHEEGLGVTQSFLRAHLFYNLAAAKGSTGARDARNAIATKMTAETLDQAQELAEGWPESAKRLAK